MRFGPIDISTEKITDFCRQYQIQRMRLFGSALRGELRDESDIDILIEFLPGQTPSLLTLGGMQVELSELLGREVDLKTPGFIAPRILEQVLRTAEIKYAA